MKYIYHPIDVGCKYRHNFLIFKQKSRKKAIVVREKRTKVPLASQSQFRYGVLACRGLTLKPVRAGQGIGRGGAQRNPCEWTSQSSINPVRGDRLCVSITYCRPDGAWTCVFNCCRGFTRLRLVTPLPMPCSPLAGLFPGH